LKICLNSGKLVENSGTFPEVLLERLPAGAGNLLFNKWENREHSDWNEPMGLSESRID